MQHIKSDNHPSDVTMKLKNSTSDQNVVVTYVCLINDVKPTGSRNDNVNHVNQPHKIRYGVNEVSTYQYICTYIRDTIIIDPYLPLVILILIIM